MDRAWARERAIATIEAHMEKIKKIIELQTDEGEEENKKQLALAKIEEETQKAAQI